MHIFTELVGIQMLLMNTLEPLLRGDKSRPEQLTILFRPSQNHQGREGSGTPRQAQPEQGEVVMPTVQRWGRIESLIWPPRTYLYTSARSSSRSQRPDSLSMVHFPVRLFTARTLLPAVLSRARCQVSRHSCQHLSVYSMFQTATRGRDPRRRDVRSGRPRNPRARHCRRAFRAGKAQGFRLLSARSRALPEPDLSRMAAQ